MKLCFRTSLSGLLLASVSSALLAEEGELTNLTLEDLLQIKVVTASRSEETSEFAPGVITVISKQEIERFGGKNLIEVLERSPSVLGLGSYLFPQNVISIRSDLLSHFNNHVLLLINGRPVRESLTGGIDAGVYLTFPIQTLNRIEVIRGPGSVLYGTNAYSGVINLITDKKQEEFIQVGVGEFDTSELQASISGEDWFVGLKYLNSDGWPFNAFDEIGAPINLDYAQENLGLIGSFKLADVDVSWFHGSSEQTNLGAIPILAASNVDQPFDTSRTFFDVSYTSQVSDDFQLEFNTTYNKFTEDIDVASNPFAGESEDWLIEVTAKQNLSDNWRLLYGANAYIQSGKAIQAGAFAVPKYSETWYRFYGEVEYLVENDFKVVFGGQFNKPENVDSNFVGRFALIKQFSEQSNLKVLYGEAFRSAFEIENSLNAPGVLFGSSDLNPESISTFDVQWNYQFDKGHFKLNYFQSEQTDIITRVPIPNSPANTYDNLGKLESDGFEIEYRYIPSENFMFTASATTQSNQLNNTIDNATLMPESMIKLGASWKPSDDFTISVFDSWMGDFGNVSSVNPAVNPFNGDAEDFHYVTANLIYQINNQVEAQLNITNLLDEDIHYPEFSRQRVDSFPGRAGQASYLSIKWTF